MRFEDFVHCPRCTAALEIRQLGGADRKVCPAEGCGFVFWGNPTPVVAAVIGYRGEILLVRNVGWPAKMFGLVTGFLERDEDPEEGVRREVQEETSLRATNTEWIGAYPFPQRNQVLLCWFVEAEGEIALNEELEEVKLLAPEKLRPWPFGTGHAVRDWLKSRGYDVG